MSLNHLISALVIILPTVLSERDPLCPYPSDEITFFEYPGNCSKYYECYEGKKYTMQCPEDLFWNEELKTCDYKSHVKCDNQTTVTTTGTTKSFLYDICSSNPEVPTYYVYPGDCTKYFECYQGKKYELQCATPLYWNQEKKTCDYKENVKCSKYYSWTMNYYNVTIVTLLIFVQHYNKNLSNLSTNKNVICHITLEARNHYLKGVGRKNVF